MEHNVWDELCMRKITLKNMCTYQLESYMLCCNETNGNAAIVATVYVLEKAVLMTRLSFL